MNKVRRIGAVVTATVAAVGMASVGTVAPAAAARPGPQPVSTWLRAVRANTGTWINVYWRTDRRICDAEVRFSGARVGIDYPGPRDYTSFSRGDWLRPGRVDYTAVEVTPYFNRAGIALLRATIEYDNCGPRAGSQRRSTVLMLPVIRNGSWDDHNGNGGHGNGGHGNGGHGNGGHGNGGHGGHGQGSQGTGGQGTGGQDTGGQGTGGQGTGGQGTGGQGTGGQGTGGHGTGGQHGGGHGH